MHLHKNLRSEVPPRSLQKKTSPIATRSEPNGDAIVPAKLDGEGKTFWSDFKTTSKFMVNWLPRYRESVQNIKQALLAESLEELLKTFWKTQDNDIANAGAGLLKFDTVDEMGEDLVQVIRDVYANSSADNFERIVMRFESWRDKGRIRVVPRLLIARTFAGIHPNLYHTVVDTDSQDKAIRWFVEHTGFVAPKSRNWADRAQALTTHMSQIEEIDKDIFIRNMFPWFVVEQVRAQKPSESFQPGHRPRAPITTSDIPEHQQKIDLRHNRVQDVLYNRLAAQYGKDKVGTECPTGTGGYADAVVKLSDDKFHLYEIKIAGTATEVLRQAMGQLLEYGFRKGGVNPVKLFAVGEPALDEVTEEFIGRLRRDFNLNLTYLRIELED